MGAGFALALMGVMGRGSLMAGTRAFRVRFVGLGVERMYIHII